MKVLHIADYSANHYGGFARSQTALAKAIVDRGYEVKYAFTGYGPHVDKLLKYAEVQIGHTRRSKRFDFGLFTASYKLCEGWKPDIVNVHFGQSSLLCGIAIASSTGGKLLWHVRGALRSSKKLRKIVSKLYYAILTKYCIDGVVAVSDSIKNVLVQDGYASSKCITVINNAIDIPSYPINTKTDWVDLYNRTGLDMKNKRIVVMVANFGPAKDHCCFVEAISIVRKRFPDVVGLLVGESLSVECIEYKTRIREYAARAGLSDYLGFTGQMEEVYSTLAACEICVLCSHGEGLPNSILEYMAMAKPVVASNVSGVRDIITSNQVGILYQPGDCESLARSLEGLLNDKTTCSMMGTKSRELVIARFGMDQWVEKMLFSYQEAIAL